MIDGSKALRKAVRQVFGNDVPVQRCTQHKQRNVLDLSPRARPPSRQSTVASGLEGDRPRLRAKVRLRHSLVDQRGEWQQRIRAVLYHHGFPRCSDLDLLTAAGRDWLTELSLPAAAREQITIALEMISALDAQIPAIDQSLRAYARRQTGTRALMGHYGIGSSPRSRSSPSSATPAGSPPPVCRALRRPGHHRAPSDLRRAPGHLSRQGPPVLRWALYEAAQAATRASSPTTPTTAKPRSGSGTTAPASRSRATSSNAATTPSKNSATRRSSPHKVSSCAPRPTSADAPRPAPGILLPPRPRGRPPKTERPHRNFPQREPITIMSPPGSQPESWTEISMGTRAHRPTLNNLRPQTGGLDRR